MVVMVVVVAGAGVLIRVITVFALTSTASYPVFYHGYSLRLLCIFAIENLCNV